MNSNYKDTRDPSNIDSSKLKLIGYYKSDSPKLNAESIYIDEACELAKLLGDSFYASECICSLDEEFYSELLHSIMIFKNYHGHLFAYLPTIGIAIISEVQFNRESIILVPAEYKMYFTPGDAFTSEQNQLSESQLTKKVGITKVTLDVIRTVRKDELVHYEVSYGGSLCYVRLFPFQIEMMNRGIIKKQVACFYQGLDQYGAPRLAQDRDELIDELYEEDTVHNFSYMRTEIDYHKETNCEYHLLRDSYGLKHRLYADLPEDHMIPGTRIEVYVCGINKRSKTLILSIFNPNIDRLERIFFSADTVFEEIGETDNKELYFDCYFNIDEKHISKLYRDLINQYKGEQNLWLFTYMNILDTIVVGNCIRKHQIEELAIVCEIMIKLQEWMLEGSTFLDLFGEKTKATTITKLTAQIQKFNRLLLGIDVVRKGEQNKYISDIIVSIQKSGRIAIRREERLEVMINILRIYPEYFTQDIESTCQLINALLNIEEGIGRFEVDFLSSRLNYYIEADVRKMRSGTLRSNEIDTTQTLLINEVLSLLCMKVMIHTSDKYANELEARTSKARFFRFLSFVSSEDMQPTILKAGVDALVGVIDSNSIFTWENAKNINPIALCNLTAQATVLDCNTDNDFYHMKSTGKTGIIRLDPTGFTIIPYKQCVNNFRLNSEFMDDIKVMHRLETLPIKLGTMFNISTLNMDIDPVEQFLLWKAVSKHPENLTHCSDLYLPQIGDRVKVCVKEQNQSEKLKYMLFVTLVDNQYSSVDGILTPKDITGKWIGDTRKLFNVGQVFYAEVCNITPEGKYQFSIRKEIDKYSTSTSSVEDDLKHIIKSSGNTNDYTMLSNSFVQELILLVDMQIRKEINATNRLTLIGYAYCLSALASDPKSYYYDFLLRYYAAIDKFITNEHKDVTIKFHDTTNNLFANIANKRRLVELLSYANSQETEGIQSLQQLVTEEADNDAGKLAAMLITYIYAIKAGFSAVTLVGIKNEINSYVGNTVKLDLSALNSDGEDSKLPAKESVVIDKTENPDIIENEEQADNNIEEVVTETVIHARSVKCAEVQKPLRLNIFNDGSMIVVEDSPKSERYNPVLEIFIPSYALDGVLILVNNEGGISQIKVQDIASAELLTKFTSKVNPYKLSNYFVVPSDCIIGTIITSKKGKFIEAHNSIDLPTSNLLQPEYTQSKNVAIIRHQPFILPESWEIHGLNDFMGKCIESNDVPEMIIQGLQSYGVFI